jgi:Fe-S cluster assembly iron-binding protein IscA
MIQVTERAREALSAVQSEMVDRADVALRLAPTAEGQLSVFPDTGRDDDHVVEHEGHAVLLIEPGLVEELAGTTIDFEETLNGARFTLNR